MENITKSIIYGNFYENRYGKFLPVCSSITDRCKHPIIKLQSRIYSTICIRPPTSKNITEQRMPIECNKSQLFSSQKKRI